MGTARARHVPFAPFTAASRAHRTRGQIRPSYRPLCESLESRALLAQVTWVGLAGTNSFHDAANWNTGTVPGPGDDVIIPDMPGDLPLYAGDIQLRSLDCSERLSGGSLRLSGPSELRAEVQSMAVHAIGPAAILTVHAFDPTDSINFFAENGANVLIDQPGGLYDANELTLIADGPGSRITVPDLQRVMDHDLNPGINQIRATNGGVIELPDWERIILECDPHEPVFARYEIRVEGPNSRIIAPRFRGGEAASEALSYGLYDSSTLFLNVRDGGHLESDDLSFGGNVLVDFQNGVLINDLIFNTHVYEFFDSHAGVWETHYVSATFIHLRGEIGGKLALPGHSVISLTEQDSPILRVGGLYLPETSTLHLMTSESVTGSEHILIEVAGHADLLGSVSVGGTAVNAMTMGDRIVVMTHASAVNTAWAWNLNGNPALCSSTATQTAVEVIDDLIQFSVSDIVVSEQGPGAEIGVSFRYPFKGGNASIVASVSPVGEAAMSQPQLVFDPSHWSIPQSVFVLGVEDFEVDGNQPFSVHFSGWALGSAGADISGISLDSANPPLPPGFSITELLNGLTIQFQDAMRIDRLNLHDGQAGLLGPPDFELVGDASGSVKGTLIPQWIDEGSSTTYLFICDQITLPEDMYTIRIRGAEDGFVNREGVPFDGDGDGTPGGVLTRSLYLPSRHEATPNLVVEASVVGPGQDLGYEGEFGVPLLLQNPGDATSIFIDFGFLISGIPVLDATISPTMPPDWSLAIVSFESGIQLEFRGNTPLTADEFVHLGWVQASIPVDIPYGTKSAFRSFMIAESPNGNGTSSTRYSPLIFAYPGDLNGNGAVTASDVVQLRRSLTGIDPGIPAFPLVSPSLLTDLNRSGTTSPADITVLRRFIVGLPQSSIPPIPGGIIINQEGTDPKIWIPRNLKARRGEVIQIPIWFEHTGDVPIDLHSLDLALQFDPRAFTFLSASPTGLAPAEEWLVSADSQSGRLAISAAAGDPIPLEPGAAGPVALLNFQVKANARLGRTVLNLLETLPADGRGTRPTAANDGHLLLIPAPTNRPDDPVDGILLIGQQSAVPVRFRPRDIPSPPGDSTRILQKEIPPRPRFNPLRSLARLHRLRG